MINQIVKSYSYKNLLSVVIQGSIESKEGVDCICKLIKSIEINFPECEIIVSTWDNYDKSLNSLPIRIITSKDPGELSLNKTKITGFTSRNYIPINKNTLRMLHSSYVGVALSRGLFIIKLRSDMNIKNFDPIKKVVNDAMINRVKWTRKFAILDLYTRSPLKSALLFHGSDILFAGLKNEVYDLLKAAVDSIQEDKPLPCLCPEQYLWTPYVKGSMTLSINEVFDFSFKDFRIWSSFLKNNIILINNKEIEPSFLKKKTGFNQIDNCLQSNDLERLNGNLISCIEYLLISIRIRINLIISYIKSKIQLL